MEHRDGQGGSKEGAAMKIYNGSVIIWTADGGKVFNDITKADRYFDEQMKAKKNPCWERVFRFNYVPNKTNIMKASKGAIK